MKFSESLSDGANQWSYAWSFNEKWNYWYHMHTVRKMPYPCVSSEYILWRKYIFNTLQWEFYFGSLLGNRHLNHSEPCFLSTFNVILSLDIKHHKFMSVIPLSIVWREIGLLAVRPSNNYYIILWQTFILYWLIFTRCLKIFLAHLKNKFYLYVTI